jgi:hypothetical protein
MASLLVTGSILAYEKMKMRRAAKKEKKRNFDQERYNELQRETTKESEEKQLSRTMRGSQQESQGNNEARSRSSSVARSDTGERQEDKAEMAKGRVDKTNSS